MIDFVGNLLQQQMATAFLEKIGLSSSVLYTTRKDVFLLYFHLL
jgi:hypothetical protein